VNPGGVQVNDVRRRIRWLLAERAMWTVAIVVAGVLAEDRRQMALAMMNARRTVPTSAPRTHSPEAPAAES
jgi:hypothetical protein